jgi:hypothetical protein
MPLGNMAASLAAEASRQQLVRVDLAIFTKCRVRDEVAERFVGEHYNANPDEEVARMRVSAHRSSGVQMSLPSCVCNVTTDSSNITPMRPGLR